MTIAENAAVTELEAQQRTREAGIRTTSRAHFVRTLAGDMPRARVVHGL